MHIAFCWRSAECSGRLMDIKTNVTSGTDCLKKCKEATGCHYFNYATTDQICALLLTCPNFVYGCHGRCLSGQVSCLPPSENGPGLTKILTVTGSGSNGFNTKPGLVTDLSGQNLECNELPSYPLGVKNAVGGLINGKPTICGGKQSGVIVRYKI